MHKAYCRVHIALYMESIINIVTKARDENLKISEKLFEDNKIRPLFKTQEKDFQTYQINVDIIGR